MTYLAYYALSLFGSLVILAVWVAFWLWGLQGLPGYPAIVILPALAFPTWFAWSWRKAKIKIVESRPIGRLFKLTAEQAKHRLDHENAGTHFVVSARHRPSYDRVCTLLGSRGEPIPLREAGVWIPLNKGLPSCHRWFDMEGRALTAVFFDDIADHWWVNDEEDWNPH